MLVTRTPFRISLFGGGTDYPTWTEKNEGAVLSFTIDKYCWLSVRHLPPFFPGHVHRIVWSRVEEVQQVDQIQHPVVRACLDYLGIDTGVEIHHQGDLPARSGMGSSSAFTVGLFHALSALEGDLPGKAQLAKTAVKIEQEILKETVGAQDQYAAAYGGLNVYRFGPEGVRVHPIPIGSVRRQALNARLHLFYVGPRKEGVTGSVVASSYVPKSHHLRTMAAMVDEGVRLLTDGDLDGVGALLHDAWALKKELGGVTDDRVDALYSRALSAGALGGKLLGAGGGGFLLLYVPLATKDNVLDALADLLRVPFAFDMDGSRLVYFGETE